MSGSRMHRRQRTRLAGGRFLRNLARTTPDLPCGRVTLPQMVRYRLLRFFVLAL